MGESLIVIGLFCFRFAQDSILLCFMLMIIFTIFNIYLENDVLDVISNILVYVALALTVISLIDYMLKNKDVLKDQK